MKKTFTLFMSVLLFVFSLNNVYGKDAISNNESNDATVNSTVQSDTYLDNQSVINVVYGERYVTQDVYLIFPEFIKGTVSTNTYKRNSMMIMSEPSREPQLIDAIKKVNIKEPQSLYSLSSGTESISTLSGDVQVQETDLTLPGRNGLSFSLTRFYSSTSSNAYNKETEYAPYCNCSTTIDGYWGLQWSADKINVMYNETHLVGYYLWNNGTINENGNIKPGMPNYDGSYTVLQDAMAYNSYLSSKAINTTVNPGNWAGPDYRGLFYRSASWTGSDVRFDIGGNLTSFWRTIARNKPYEQQLYPLGSGWSWDIPFIKTVSETNTSYLSMGIEGSYEISGNTLIGYPWKDRWLEESSIVVGNERSSRVLRTKEKKSYYFGGDGRLILITDAYNNSIKFSYINDSKYGKVLSTITDALDNTITITYDNWGIWLTKGADKIRYTIQTTGYTRPFPYLSFQPTSYLTDVSHLVGPDTQYFYDYKNAETNYALNYPVNNPYYLLKSIKHPSGARTEFTYQASPTTRSYGMYSTDQVYKVTSRKDITSSGTYNFNEYIYHSDLASSFNGNIDSFGTTVRSNKNNLVVDTLYDYRKVYNDSKSVYYTKSITTTAGDERTISTFKYDEGRKISIPQETTKTFYKGQQASSPEKTSVLYDDYGNVISQTNANQVTSTYSYDNNSHLLSSMNIPINNGSALNVQYTRNNQGDITETVFKDQLGTVLSKTNYEIDSYGNPTKVTIQDDNRSIVQTNNYGSDNAFLRKQTIDVSTIEDTQKIITEAEYNTSTGEMSWVEDGRDNRTNYEYDAYGRIRKIINPGGSFSEAIYNDAQNEVVLKDETGVQSKLRWNELGWKIEEGVFKPNGYQKLKSYQYDSYGRVSGEGDAEDRFFTYSYDAWDRLISSTTPKSETTTTIYDDLQRTQTIQDPTGVRSRVTFDILGQKIKTEIDKNKGKGFEQSGYWRYDFAGNAVEEQNSTFSKINSYDALNRLIEVKQPNGEKTAYSYSLAGALKKITHPDGTVETSQYDELGRRMQHTDGSGKSKKYLYDKAGNVTKLIDKGYQTTTYEYNNRNWLARKTVGGNSIGYQYDSAGRRTSMTDGTGVTGYYYTPGVGVLETTTYPDGKKLQYTYNKQGLRETMTDPFGLKLYYGYDGLNRLQKVGQTETTAMAEYGYHSNGLLKDIKLENGTSTTMNYNGYDLSDLTQLQGASTVLNRHTYTWSPDGNQLSKTDLVAGQSKNVQYGYDSLNRIETSTEFNELYVYDLRGNRQTLVSNQAPKLQEASYSYDGFNQLTGASVVGKSPVAYKYNGDGLMVERAENGSTRRYYYDGDQIIAEATVNGTTITPVAQYIRGKQLIARLSGTTKHFYYYNGHGDVTELRSSTGALINRYSYDMWGNPLSVSEQVANPFRYSGEFWDSTTELQYLRARWYDPSMGRFMSEDTFEGQFNNPLTLNLYTYVYNNPLIYTDPTGHCGFKSWGDVGDCALDFIPVVGGVKSVQEALTGTNLVTGENLSVADRVIGLAGIVPGGKVAAKGVKLLGSEVKIGGKIVSACNCFTAGTKVITDEGEKNIEDIEVGDRVLSKDEVTGQQDYKEVTALHRNEKDTTYKLSVGNQIIEATDNHPFWVDGKGWVLAVDLTVGDELVQSNGNHLKIDNIEIVHHDEKIKVYNFTVADFHTYFVSSLGIWVHNIECLPVTSFTTQKLQHEWKHAKDFGINGNSNKAGWASYQQAIEKHIQGASNVWKSKYRGNDVYVYYDKNTGLGAYTDLNGNYVGGWKFSDAQVEFHKNNGQVLFTK
ncbi:polymorphic toxin-type HINT domain-containing protein [Paenibacillus pasadenensis]|uniref:polymorphic toxin-type HINT domain-containing protein n=1 Tax=Paenibacillus pasadenensis TaxID=217090 RepID=UPI000407EDBB|nr:polymorphic toxin-type HINT domain-containing protein [Paenibacillus pasadenensis]